MSVSVGSFFRKYDQFGFSHQLRIEGDNSYKTLIGGFLTISVFFLYAIGIIYFGQELWRLKEPIVVASSKEYDILPDIKIGKEDFSIYMNIATKYYVSFIDNTIFTARAEIYEYKNGSLVNTIPMEINPCTSYYNSSSEISNKTVVKLKSYYCIKPDEYKLYGVWGAEAVSQAHVYFERCVNTTKNINNPCKSPEEIEATLEGGVIGFYATNFIKRISNYENPVSAFIQDNFHTLDLERPITSIISIRQLSFTTDIGFLLEDSSTIIKPYFDNIFWQSGSKQGGLIAHIHLLGFPLGESILRRYSKVQDVSTKIGGLGSFLKFIAYLIGSFYSHLQYRADLLDNITQRSKKFEESNINDNFKLNKSEKVNIINLKNNNSEILNSMNLSNQNKLIKGKTKDKFLILSENFPHQSVDPETYKSKLEEGIKTDKNLKDDNKNKYIGYRTSNDNMDKIVSSVDKEPVNAFLNKNLSKIKIDVKEYLNKSIYESSSNYSSCSKFKSMICDLWCLDNQFNSLQKKNLKNILDKISHCLSIENIISKTIMVENLSNAVYKDKLEKVNEIIEKNLLNKLLEESTVNFTRTNVFEIDNTTSRLN
jgi:hypothetical protein